MMKNIFLFICVSFHFTIDTVARADMIVDGDAIISENTIIGILGNTSSINNETIRFNGTDLEGYVEGNWQSLITDQVREPASLGIGFLGFVGIGTYTPASQLDVAGKITLTTSAGAIDLDMSTSDSYADMRVIRNTNTAIDDNLYLNIGPDPFAEIKINSSGLETMTIENGNVGIGTTTPASKHDKLMKNVFVIAYSEPNVEVSWQITGIRQDAYANKNRIPNEADKKANEKSYYLHPKAFNHPLSKKVKVEGESIKGDLTSQQKLKKGVTVQD